MNEINPNSFVDYLKDRPENDRERYLFKIEKVGDYFETQDVKPFQSSVYKKIASISAFVNWLNIQPAMMDKLGYCEEITEIWHLAKAHLKWYGKESKDRTKEQWYLIWTKEKGWIRYKHFNSIYKEK